MIRHIIIMLFFLSITITGKGQKLSEPMERAVNACIKLSQAIGSGGTQALRTAAQELRRCGTTDFSRLTLVSGQEISLDGHYIFDEVFADSLVTGRKVTAFSRKYARKRADRGVSPRPGQVLLSTKAVEAGSKVIYNTTARGVAEFAVVAEPGGLITMRILSPTGKALYSETKSVKKGAAVRKASVSLPSTKSTTVSIEITNHSAKATSFAILSL